jgi:Zn-dependent protease
MSAEIGLGLLWYAVFVVSLTLHEAAHAFAGLWFGDATARDAGLVTLDPLAHIHRSPFGMVVVPIVSYLIGGWMIGWASTPYDEYWASRNRKQAALMALAGPAANLLLVLIAGVLIRGGMLFGVFTEPEVATAEQMTSAVSPGTATGAAVLVSVIMSLNLLLLVFNMLPLPSLDGSKVFLLFIKDSAAQRYREMMAQPAFQIIGLVVAWNLLDFLLHPARAVVLNLLYPGAGYH